MGDALLARDAVVDVVGDVLCESPPGPVARAELQRGVAVLFLSPLSHDLDVVELQHRHRNLFSGFGEDAGHAHLLSDHT